MQFADYILNGVTLDLFRQGFIQLQNEFEYKDAEYDYARKLFPRPIEYEKRRQSSTEVMTMKIYPVEHMHTYNLYVPVENPDGTESRNPLLSIEVTTLSNTKEQLKMTLRWEDNAENMKKVISKWARNVYNAHPWEQAEAGDTGEPSTEPTGHEKKALPISKGNTPEGDELLTERENEVAQLLALGKGQAEIAKDLVISSNTVRAHTYNITNKWELRQSEGERVGQKALQIEARRRGYA